MGDDAVLIAGCLRGEHASWTRLLDHYGRWVYAVVARQLERYGFRDRQHLKEEIYQEVFCYLVEKNALSRIENPKALKSYLTAIAVSRTLDAIRSLVKAESRHAVFGDDEALDSRLIQLKYSDRLAEKAHSSEIEALLKEELNLLPQTERLVLQLRWYQGLKISDVAKAAGLPENSVSSILSRGREKMKIRLERKGIRAEDLEF